MMITRAVAKSIKRLYEAGRLTQEEVKARVDKGTLTADEYAEIVGEAYET